MENLSDNQNNSISPLQHLKNFGNKLVKTTLFITIPVGILYVINLPYPAIRRPISEKVPLLLLPSQITTEYHFKKSINLMEQAQQLIDNATSQEDLQLGEKKLQEAKQSLNAIPVYPSNDLFGGSYGYGWRFSSFGFQEMRGKVGELEAKIFQEKNAQTLFKKAELAFNEGKNNYENAKNNYDKQQAIKTWKLAINNLEEIPVNTLAGEKAQQKLSSNREELEAIIGNFIQTEKLNTIITSAQQFSLKAVELSKNPPYKVEKWTEIENQWKMAIKELENISLEDGNGYIEAKKLMAEYNNNLSEIQQRKKAEEKSIEAFNYAKN
ncbi:MAG: hypothetical protein GW795_10750 [Cyanobacteria bacterium]|nr:hypothetical protein [Cyanobacteria bacterium CG_2015-16_32_12]NCO79399.1 hypothetical protein [Cyanobacteria bacterium CG_2015-22_32_23]NCQ03403.1 hypothetical protein [Cyanobacteria bacterium CG_2015-09_32_10]NCQ42334.1 hypothetical protein [Cyanobacteria bacterium CG_2015-04_32_10]NCS85719.1 hypothetical protein [Cyanobacteria bacterium CG_2015-02_32_10]